MKLTGYGAYKLFLGIKNHFYSSTYDYFKYQGKTNASMNSYNERSDKQFFERLSKRYQLHELRDLYVSNMLVDRCYVTDLLDEEANDTFLDFKSRTQSLSYRFRNDVKRIFKNGLKEPFSITRGAYPNILILFLRGTICIETLVILNDYINYIPKLNKCVGENDILWTGIRNKILKYKPFLKYDEQKLKDILKETVYEQR